MAGDCLERLAPTRPNGLTVSAPLKIGFIGNQNNYPFLLARALRDAGHDVRFVVDQPDALDRPERRYADVPYPYPAWIVETQPVQIADVVYQTARWQHVLDLMHDRDALVLNRWAFAAAWALDKPAFCLTTGADAEYWSRPSAAHDYARQIAAGVRGRNWVAGAFALAAADGTAVRDLLERTPDPLYRAWHAHVFRRFARAQREGLRRAVAVSAFPDAVSPTLAEVMGACLGPHTRRYCLLMADTQWIQPTPPPRNAVLRVFNGSRLLWKPPFPDSVGWWENKGTDILLHGIALARQRTGLPLDIRLVEKGPSVEATKALVRSLALDRVVSWQSELTQATVFEEYRRADIVTEQCGRHVLGLAGYEAMAAGRPVVANARPEIFTSVFGRAIPVAQARTPEEVASQFERLRDPTERERLGREGRAFVESHLSPAKAASLVASVLGNALDERRRRGLAA